MSEPLQPWQGEVWQRGAKLGLIWLGVMIAATAILFAIMGVLGWSGRLSALCALCVGPIIGLSVIAGWWVVRRPELHLVDGTSAAGGKGDEDESVE